MQIGILGAGSFGLAMANVLAENGDVLLYSRRPEMVETINRIHLHNGVRLSKRITATSDMAEVCHTCNLIFPIVSSAHFRSLMQTCAPFLRPHHILIHGTKGFDVTYEYKGGDSRPKLRRDDVHTMSEVIRQETNVVRIGCLSGPNLANEINSKQPTGTVVASHFTEVIKAGQKALGTPRFQVFGSYELTGAELAGAMKNTIAIGSGILAGSGLGKNIWALLVTRGINEMVTLGKAMGAAPKAFLGVAGIGDLVATAASAQSRNYSVGFRLAKGETLESIAGTMTEVAEGVRTTKIIKEVADYYNVKIPVVTTIYKVLYENMTLQDAITYLMTYPYTSDVDFL
jgi:glycerol-3-phosphate dehydrogenase (NAD(P)+)